MKESAINYSWTRKCLLMKYLWHLCLFRVACCIIYGKPFPKSDNCRVKNWNYVNTWQKGVFKLSKLATFMEWINFHGHFSYWNPDHLLEHSTWERVSVRCLLILNVEQKMLATLPHCVPLQVRRCHSFLCHRMKIERTWGGWRNALITFVSGWFSPLIPCSLDLIESCSRNTIWTIATVVSPFA